MACRDKEECEKGHIIERSARPKLVQLAHTAHHKTLTEIPPLTSGMANYINFEAQKKHLLWLFFFVFFCQETYTMCITQWTCDMVVLVNISQ